MERRELYALLLELAEQVGLGVRDELMEPKRSSGGLVKLRGRWVVLLDAQAPLPERIAILGAALGRFDLSGQQLAAEVKRTLSAMSRRTQRGRTPALPLAEPAPKRAVSPGVRNARPRPKLPSR